MGYSSKAFNLIYQQQVDKAVSDAANASGDKIKRRR